MGRLQNTTTYLAGGIDRVDDCGVGWRREIYPFLIGMGIHVYDPTSKPINDMVLDETDRTYRQQLIDDGKLDEMTQIMKVIKGYDLRGINKSDFVILYIDMGVHMCGSYHEMAEADHEGKPILVVCKQGKKAVPWWIYSVVPHEEIFSSVAELMVYLKSINQARELTLNEAKRWIFPRTK